MTASDKLQLIIYLPNWKVFNLRKLASLARSTDLPVTIAQERDQVSEIVDRDIPSANFLLITETTEADFVASLETSLPNLKTVLFSAKKSINHTANKLKSLVSDYGSNDGSFDSRDLTVMFRKLQNGNIFGLEKYIGVDADIHHSSVDSLEGKNAVLSYIHKQVSDLAGPRDYHKFFLYAARITSIADELIISSMTRGGLQFNQSTTNDGVNTTLSSPVSISWGFDGDKIGISIKDTFGRLTKESFFDCLNFDPQHKKSDRLDGKRNIEFALRRGNRFVVNTALDGTAEIICLMSLTKRMREQERQVKTIAFYEFKADLAV